MWSELYFHFNVKLVQKIEIFDYAYLRTLTYVLKLVWALIMPLDFLSWMVFVPMQCVISNCEMFYTIYESYPELGQKSKFNDHSMFNYFITYQTKSFYVHFQIGIESKVENLKMNMMIILERCWYMNSDIKSFPIAIVC